MREGETDSVASIPSSQIPVTVSPAQLASVLYITASSGQKRERREARRGELCLVHGPIRSSAVPCCKLPRAASQSRPARQQLPGWLLS